jgi:CHAT domain-containing protein/Flp pilus assembly protein TadD
LFNKVSSTCLILVRFIRCALVVIALSFGLVVAQSPAGLMRGQVVEREIKPGERHLYNISLGARQYLHFNVDQRGIDVAVELLGPNGKEILTSDAFNGAWGPETASWVTQIAGTYQLTITADAGALVPGKYEVSLTDLRPPKPPDLVRVKAERLTMDSVPMQLDSKPESQRKALANYEAALPLWRRLNDRYEEALTTMCIGDVYAFLDDLPRAEQAMVASAAILRKLRDRRGQAMVLLKLGKIYRRRDQFDKALKVLNEAIDIRRVLADRAGEAELLLWIGLTYSRADDVTKATLVLNQALSSMTVEDHSLEDPIRSNLADIYLDSGEPRKAITELEPLLGLRSKSEDKEGQADALSRLGKANYRAENNEAALRYYQLSLDLWRGLGKRAEEADVLTDLGTANNRIERFKEALDYYQQALQIHTQLENLTGEMDTLDQIGAVYAGMKNKDKSLEYLDKSAELFRQAMVQRKLTGDWWCNAFGVEPGKTTKLPAHPSDLNQRTEAERWRDRATEARSRGQELEAAAAYEKAAALFHQLSDRAAEADAFVGMALSYSETARVDRAIESARRAVALGCELGDSEREFSALHSLIGVYDAFNMKQEVKKYTIYVYSIGLKDEEMRQVQQIYFLERVAEINKQRDETALGLEHYREAAYLAVRIRRSDLGGNILLDWANYLRLLKLYDDAGNMAEGALDVFRLLENPEGQAAALGTLAQVHDLLGQHQLAIREYEQGLLLCRRAKVKRLEPEFLGGLMVAYAAEKKPVLAIALGKQAINGYQEIRGNVQNIDGAAQTDYINSRQWVYRRLADLLITEDRPLEAERVLGLLKEEEYRESVRGGEAEMSGSVKLLPLTPADESLKEGYERENETVTSVGLELDELVAKSSLTPAEQERKKHLNEKLKVANDSFQKFLDNLYAETGRSKTAAQNVQGLENNADEMQNVLKELDPGTVALFTLVGDDKYRVIVITPYVVQAREYPITSEELKRKVFALQHALRHPDSDPLSPAQELYQILIGPIAADLEGAKAHTLMWSLDGVLRYIPIAALHDGKQYVVERYRNVVFTPRSMPYLRDKADVASAHGVGLGVSKSYGGMPALPSVPEELHGIIHDEASKQLGGVVPGQVVLDDAFTEDALKTALDKKYTFVHIATHFEFRSGSLDDSYLLLGGSANGLPQTLSLGEIRRDSLISFHGVELVTLSACNTAVIGTQSNGRELDSFGMTAQGKGAKAVLATLWPVYDRSTGLLMQNFYQNWSMHISKSEALQRAQLLLLHGSCQSADKVGRCSEERAQSEVTHYAHPYYWAPFVLMGNWR